MTIQNQSGQEIYDFLRAKNINNVEFLKDNDGMWDFILNKVKIPTISGEIPYHLNIQNFSVLYLLLNDKNVFSNNTRQSFATITRCIFYLWKMKTCAEFKLNIISKNQFNGMSILDKIIEINERLDEDIKIDNKQIKNKVNIINVESDKKIIVENKIRAINNNSRVFIDDFEFIMNIKTVWETLVPLLNYNVKIDCCSSVGSEQLPGKKLVDKLIMNDFIHWNTSMLDVDINKSFIKNDIYYVKYNYHELFKNPEEWFSKMCEILNNDRGIIAREIELRR